MSKRLKRYKDKWVFKLKRHFMEVLKSHNSEQSIAWGFAVGSFIAIMPTPGFSTMIGLVTIAIFKKLNKLAVLIALALYNGVTVLPYYWLSFQTGAWIFQDPGMADVELTSLEVVYEYGYRFVIGSLFVITPYSIASFYFAKWVVAKIRKKRNIALAES